MAECGVQNGVQERSPNVDMRCPLVPNLQNFQKELDV